MLSTVLRTKPLPVCLILTASLSLFLGCSKKQAGTDTTDNKPADANTASTATTGGAGETVFKAKCASCHTINGSGGHKGPDLSHVGAEAQHTASWLTEFIKNPQSKKPGARMPGFEGKISDQDLQALTGYLADLK